MAVDITPERYFANRNTQDSINTKYWKKPCIPWMSDSEIARAKSDLEAFRKENEVFAKMLPVPKHPMDGYSTEVWKYKGDLGNLGMNITSTSTSNIHFSYTGLGENSITTRMMNVTGPSSYTYSITSSTYTTVSYDVSYFYNDSISDETTYTTNIMRLSSGNSYYYSDGTTANWITSGSYIPINEPKEVDIWGNTEKVPDFWNTPMGELDRYYRQKRTTKVLPWDTDDDSRYYDYEDMYEDQETVHSRRVSPRPVCWLNFDNKMMKTNYGERLYQRWKECPNNDIRKDYLMALIEDNSSTTTWYLNNPHRGNYGWKPILGEDLIDRGIDDRLFQLMHPSDDWGHMLCTGMIDKEDLEEPVLETMSKEEETLPAYANEITKFMCHILPWFKNMLRDEHSYQIASKSRIDEYFSATWFQCNNPYYRDMLFRGDSLFDKRPLLLPDFSA